MIDLSNEKILYSAKISMTFYRDIFIVVIIANAVLWYFIQSLAMVFVILLLSSPAILIYGLVTQNNVEVFITEGKLIKTGWGLFEKPIERMLEDIFAVEIKGDVVTIQGGGEAIRLSLENAGDFKKALEERLWGNKGGFIKDKE